MLPRFLSRLAAVKAVKHQSVVVPRHQFSTSTTLKGMRPHWPPDNVAHTNPELWRKVTLFGAIPAVIIVSIITWYKEYEHAKHYVRPPFIPYDYMRIQNKPFFWGDGKHTLFHNRLKNPLPDGYEEIEEKPHH